MSEFFSFPVRPVRQRGESLAGFVSRHYLANGHETPNVIHTALTTVYRSGANPMRAIAWQAVCAVTGGEHADDQVRWIERPFDGVNGQLCRKKWIRCSYSNLRICPACIAERGLHLAIWELPLVDICLLHKIVLIDKCPCGNELTWRKLKPGWKCRCKRPLTDLVAPRATVAQISMATDVLSSKGVPLPESLAMLHLGDTTAVRKDLDAHYEDVAFVIDLRALVAQTNKPRAMPARSPARAIGSIMAQWPIKFELTIVRLLKFKLRHAAGLLVALPLDGSVIRLLMHLRSAMYNGLHNEAVRSSVARVLESIDARMYADARVAFNPRFDESAKDVRLIGLTSWWNESFAPMVAPVRSMLPGAGGRSAVAPPPEDPTVYPTVTAILNFLVDAAHTRTPPERLQRLAMAWPATEDTAHLGPSQLLQRLAAQLKSATPAHIGFLAELVEQGRKAGLQ